MLRELHFGRLKARRKNRKSAFQVAAETGKATEKTRKRNAVLDAMCFDSNSNVSFQDKSCMPFVKLFLSLSLFPSIFLTTATIGKRLYQTATCGNNEKHRWNRTWIMSL